MQHGICFSAGQVKYEKCKIKNAKLFTIIFHSIAISASLSKRIGLKPLPFRDKLKEDY